MKTYRSQRKIWGAIVLLSLLVGTGIALSPIAQGQYPNDRNTQDRRDQDRNRDRSRNQNRRGRSWDQYPNWGGSFQLRQTALNAGYNEGIKQGRSDRNKRNVTDYRSRSAYRKATKDYDSQYGDLELYRRYYREAYENGYDAGINGY